MDVTTVCAIFLYTMALVPQYDAEAKTCLKVPDRRVWIPLVCNNLQWIRVIRKTSGNKTTDLGCLSSSNSCLQSEISDSSGLNVTCNGRQTCHELVQASSCIPVAGYEVTYECVKDSMNFCSPVDTYLSTVYLHSIGFPDSDKVKVKVKVNCSCLIRGALRTVTLLDHRAAEGVVTISTNRTDVWSSSSDHYNRIIAKRTEAVIINYNYTEGNGNVWIKVMGVGILHVQCGKGHRQFSSDDGLSQTIYPISTTPQVFTGAGGIAEEGTTFTVALVGSLSGVVIFLLIIVIISLLVYFKIIKPSRNRQSINDNTNINPPEMIANYSHYENVNTSTSETHTQDGGEQAPRDFSNTYSDLYRYQNQDDTRIWQTAFVW